MSEFVELITAFPAVIFTALLAFCLAWWLLATLAGLGDGVDSEPDADGALDDIGDALGISSVPPAIGLSIISFVGWVVSLAVTAAVRAADVSGVGLAVAGVVALVLAVVAGVLVARPLARRAAPLFVTELAPSEREAIGAFARVRSPEIDDDDTGSPGEIVVTSGPLRGATFRAKASPGRRYASGAAVHIIDADHLDGRLVVTVDDVPHELAP
jgi:hypothetical protein